MPLQYGVPFYPSFISSPLDEQIAKGPTVPDFAKGFDSFFAGQDQARKQQIQNLFSGGLPRTPDGGVDWQKATEMMLQTQGPEALPNAISAQKFGLLSNYFKNAPADAANPGLPPQAEPRVGPQSSLPDENRPDLPPSLARTAAAPAAPNQNLSASTITGVERGPVEGNPALFGYSGTGGGTSGLTPLPPDTPATGFGDRFNAAYPPGPRSEAATEDLSAQSRQPPRVYIPGPGPNEPATPQSPTGDVGATPGQGQTSGGLVISEANAQRFESAASKLYQRAEALGALDPAMGQAARARADSYSATAKQIREALTKNFELSPDQKAARDAGMSQLEYGRRQEAGKLDAKRFDEEQSAIQTGAATAARGLPKAQLGKQLTQQPGFYSGPWNEYNTTFQQFRNLFGQPGAATPSEAFNKVANDLLAEQVKSMGQSGVGRVLQSEVGIMRQSIASMGITDVSNRALLEITQRTYKKALEIAALTRNLPPNSAALNQAVIDHLQKNPMFTDDEMRNPALLGAKEPPASSARWNKQQMIQWGAQNGLKPGDPVMFNGRLGQIPQPEPMQ